jgi:hypothetical protein
VVAAAGNCGMLRDPLFVDVMKAPLGRRMQRPRPWRTAVTFMTGPLAMMKWAVAPVSVMTLLDWQCWILGLKAGRGQKYMINKVLY